MAKDNIRVDFSFWQLSCDFGLKQRTSSLKIDYELQNYGLLNFNFN